MTKEKELEVEVERFQKEVQVLRSDLEKEQGHHADTTLKSQELLRQVKTLKCQCSELAKQSQKLLEDKV